jgi:hypothetical protein
VPWVDLYTVGKEADTLMEAAVQIMSELLLRVFTQKVRAPK